MKKIVILASLILFLTGCNAEYNININSNLSILEEATLSGTDEFYEPYYKSTRNNVLKSFFENYEEKLIENHYKYDFIEGLNPYVKVQKDYSDIEKYLQESILFNDYFENINYNKNGNIIKIETEGFNPNDEDNPERFYVRKLRIAIKCSYKVINNNASEVNKKTNTFYYVMDENQDDFKILLEFDASKRFIENQNTYILMFGMVIIVIISWVVVFTNKKKSR